MPKKNHFDFRASLKFLNKKINDSSLFTKIIVALLPSVLLIALSFSPALLLSLGLFGQVGLPLIAIICSFISGRSFLHGGLLSFKNFFTELKQFFSLIRQEGLMVSLKRWINSFKKNSQINQNTPNLEKVVAKLNMDSLISLSIVSSIVYGLFLFTAAPLAVFMAPLVTLTAIHLSAALKQYITDYINRNSEQKINRLKSERKLLENIFKIHEVKTGCNIGIKAQTFGAYIPVDGILKSDSAEIQEGTQISGEQSKIRTYLRGEKVYAQTIYVGDKDIEIEATNNGDESLSYQQLESMQSKNHQSVIHQRINTLLSWFVISIFALAIIAFTAWSIASGFGLGFIVMMDIIFAACPCALGIAQYFPMSILKGFLFNKKVIIHDEALVEKYKDFDTIIFDKTGTLTELAVHEVNILNKDITNSELLLNLVKYAEECRLKGRPSDSYALAILKNQLFGQSLNVQELQKSCLLKSVNVDNICGILLGLNPNNPANTDKIDQIYIGNKTYLEKNGFNISELTNSTHGESSIYIGVKQARIKKVFGSISFEQKIRTDAQYTIDALKKQNIAIHMLTGDSFDAAKKVATQLGISDENFQADCLIENAQKIEDDNSRVMSDKELYVKKLLDAGKKILYVGDGRNDEAAAKLANIGSLAMGAASDMSGIFSATIENLSDILILKKVFAYANKIQRQVLGFSLGYTFLAMLAAAIVFPLIGMACMVGCFGICMAFSSAVALGWSALLIPIIALVINKIRSEAKISKEVLHTSHLAAAANHKPEYILQNKYTFEPQASNHSPKYNFSLKIETCGACTGRFSGYLKHLRETIGIKQSSQSFKGNVHTISFAFNSDDTYKSLEAIMDKFGSENIMDESLEITRQRCVA